MEAKKKPVEIEFYPFERKYIKYIESWSTNERPISITIPRTPNWIATMKITTLEWIHNATEWVDIIIKWINWEVYPCKKDIFKKTYDVNDEIEIYHYFSKEYPWKEGVWETLDEAMENIKD